MPKQKNRRNLQLRKRRRQRLVLAGKILDQYEGRLKMLQYNHLHRGKEAPPQKVVELLDNMFAMVKR